MKSLDRLAEYGPLAAKLSRAQLRQLLEAHDELARIACEREEVHSFFVTPKSRSELRRRIRAVVLSLRMLRRFNVEQLRDRAKRISGDPGWYG